MINRFNRLIRFNIPIFVVVVRLAVGPVVRSSVGFDLLFVQFSAAGFFVVPLSAVECLYIQQILRSVELFFLERDINNFNKI